MRFPTRLRSGFVAMVCALAPIPQAAHASALLLDTVTGNASAWSDSLNTTLAPFGLVQVGDSDVQIGRFGIFGQLIPNATATAANVRWDIFGADGTRIYDSGSVLTDGSGISTWFDSPAFSSPITLSANSDYYIGLITDASFLTRYYYPGAATVTGNGLSSPGGNQAGSNGVVTNFADPMLSSVSQFVQVGERVFPPGLSPQDVPLPQPIPLLLAAWLFASGLLALGGAVGGRRQLAAATASEQAA